MFENPESEHMFGQPNLNETEPLEERIQSAKKPKLTRRGFMGWVVGGIAGAPLLALGGAMMYNDVIGSLEYTTVSEAKSALSSHSGWHPSVQQPHTIVGRVKYMKKCSDELYYFTLTDKELPEGGDPEAKGGPAEAGGPSTKNDHYLGVYIFTNTIGARHDPFISDTGQGSRTGYLNLHWDKTRINDVVEVKVRPLFYSEKWGFCGGADSYMNHSYYARLGVTSSADKIKK